MAGQFPYSYESGEIIIKGLLAKLGMTISQLCSETDLSYTSMQRIYNGETKKLSLQVYEKLKKRWPHLRDEYLKYAYTPIFDNEEEESSSDNFNIVEVINNARKILEAANKKAEELKQWEQELAERSKRLDERAASLDRITYLALKAQAKEEDK